MHPDQSKYFVFTSRSRLEKSINSLIGLIEGIAIDGTITGPEISFLKRWLADHEELQDRHPYNELMPVVQAAISDGILSQEEREDILWLCERLRSTEYYNKTTADLQRLHGILGGIIADGVVTEDELRGLSSWLGDHEHLRTCWPYDEIGSLITAVMADKKIDEQEQKILKDFFSEFVQILDEQTIVNPRIAEGMTLVGLCAVCPEIGFAGQKFCFTGSSTRHTRADLAALVKRLGGDVVSSVTSTVSYLVIGAEGNPCWAYACYGRKVEKAVELRRAGSRLLLVHENDFHDAVADCR
jgi:NAD-dependent DNA ligase